MDLFDKRTDYLETQLKKSELDKDPYLQFQDWYEIADQKIEKDPNAFVLSTVNSEGVPSSRVVLMKQYTRAGLVFFTNYSSQKAQEIEMNKHVSLLFYWPLLNRQIRIVGNVKKIAREDSEAYFLSRPLGSQLSAIVSPQSKVIESKKELFESIKHLEEQKDKKHYCPEDWGGYLVEPRIYEFWQGSPSRLHDRFLYKYEKGLWTLKRLAP